MALIRWNPWNMDRFLDDDWEMPTIPGISRLMGQGLNLYETEDALVAEVAMPGVTEDQIDITVDDNVVRITGQSAQNQEEKDKRRYYMSSMTANYSYSFRLPESLVSDQEPQAQLHNGVLELTFKKVTKEPPKKIKVAAKAA